ncbi:DMT family transporter [Atopobacter sp. AH10]|uniref:DMT family transporter n=1 Tax=Atopobacter sp. AH10 TaxID=2315861 RepID=UPI000EF1B3E7|nr:DMT family transporter [Atopobacter sp. AH10]RLK63455.1 DMT family transporter [Atopobacter sp. AH10]
MPDKTKGIIGLFWGAVIWGGGYIATAGALQSFDTLSFLAVRFGLASLMMFIIFYKDIRKMTLVELEMGLPIGLVLFLAFGLQTYALRFTTVSNNSFLTATNVIFTPYLVWLVYKKRPSIRIFIASVMTLVAIGFLTLKSVSFSFNIGDFYTLVCAVLFSLHLIVSVRMRKVNVKITTFIQFLVVSILSTIACALVGPKIQPLTWISVGSLLYLVFFSTIICYMLQMYGIKHVNPSIMSIILSLETLFATILGVIILGEPFNMRIAISLVILLLAIALSSTSDTDAI